MVSVLTSSSKLVFTLYTELENGFLIWQGLVERVAVVFFNAENIPLERFIFRVSVNQSYGEKVEEADLQFSLRSFLIKLPLSEPLTKPLPMGCRWEITTYFRSLPEASTSEEADLWIPTDMKQWMQPPLITPVKSMSSEPMSLQLYMEHPSLSEPNPQGLSIGNPFVEKYEWFSESFRVKRNEKFQIGMASLPSVLEK
ncbi:DNA polymerase zeta processivity subunit isoform X2 [Impatiens glandulifera]|uniref:DNA polymerase zeta processivity subunit isoform X2 n=1 Tax=Impatiens glandulifera TaxID=253017 RepID=UPI001FB092DE|nr:DNA polymerase zeta processivity subunit isoform X2 [Impatiens glandulifera]